MKMDDLVRIGGKVLANLEANPIQLHTYDNEDDIGLVFSEKNKDSLRYVAQWGKWLEWNGRIWEQDQKLSVFNKVRTLCREVASREKKSRDRMLNTSTVAAIERLVRSDPVHAALPEQWDADDNLLNTPYGLVDLSNGEILPHDPDKYCTKITTAGPAGSCPTWDRFLYEITGGDTELIEFIQRVIGYACTGSIKEHALFFFYGTGGNGKGTLLNTITNILNDYAVTAPMDVFTESRHDRHPTELHIEVNPCIFPRMPGQFHPRYHTNRAVLDSPLNWLIPCQLSLPGQPFACSLKNPIDLFILALSISESSIPWFN